MAAERYTFDTNILFYALDPGTGEKHRLARNLIAAADPQRVPLLLQTLAELCNAIIKRRPDLLRSAEEFALDSTGLFTLVAAQPSDIRAALDIAALDIAALDIKDALGANRDHNIPFWDALLWAMAQRTGCTVLLTEDLQSGRKLGGVTFRNPFVMTPAELTPYLP